MSNIEWQPDGTIKSSSVIHLTAKMLETFQPSPDDATVLIPQFTACTHREYVYSVYPCGRTSGRYKCNNFNKTVCVSECKACPIK